MPTYADGIPHEEGFVRGLAQAPLYLHNAVAELVDNAIAAKPAGFHVVVNLVLRHGGAIEVTVVDDGPGIALADLETKVFKTGQPPNSTTLHLNEHGFGLKNVLAKAEEVSKDDWVVETRDSKASQAGVFYELTRPLRFKIPIKDRPASEWPKFGPAGTGTIVQFTVPVTFAGTVSKGKRGSPPSTIGTILDFLNEHLGVLYRGYLQGGKKSIGEISTSLSWATPEPIEPIEADPKTKLFLKPTKVKTSRGDLTIEGEYGLIEKTSPETKNRNFYYRHTPESQGVDFRIGSRVVQTRLVTEVWGRARHPSLNGLWGEFRIPGDKVRAPRTLNNKTSIDFEDPVWLEIADAIRKAIPEPPESEHSKDEEELRQALAKDLRTHALKGDVITENYPCFPGAAVLVDIYRDETARGGVVAVYEAKSGKAHPIDVYQLRMYWDGVVENGKRPTKGYLVAEGKSSGVDTVLSVVNRSTGQDGRTYDLEFKTWKDYNIR